MTASLVLAIVTGVCSFEDGCQTLDNPGGGLAGGGWSTLSTNQYVKVELKKPNQTKLWSLQQFSKGYVYDNDQANYANYVKKYCGDKDIPLNAVALQSVRDAFASCRANRGTVIPRFAYTSDGHGGCEPDDFEMILVHIRQLAELVTEYADVIPAVECGIIGAYGEMHTSRYTGAEYSNRIIETWLRNTPEDVRLLIRSCSYIVHYFGAKTKTELFANAASYNQSDWKRIGFYNDGYLGTGGDYGTWGGGSTIVFTRDEGIAFLESRGNVPYGGEFATIDENVYQKYGTDDLFDPAKHNLVEEWYRTHLSYLRTFRSTGMTIYQKLKAIPFVAANYASPYLPDLHEYEGVDLMQFAEDHAGARYVVRGISLERGEKTARLDLTLENTGFGEPLWEPQVEVMIVDEAGETIARTSCPFAPSMPFELPENMRSGEYRVYLQMQVGPAPFKFANEGIYDATREANCLCSFTYDKNDTASPFAHVWFAVSRDGTEERVTGGVWEGATAGRRVFRPDFTSPVGHFIRWRGTVPVEGFATLPDPAEVNSKFSFAFVEEDGEVVPVVWSEGRWTRLAQGGAARENASSTVNWTPSGANAVLDVVFDLQSEKPTARVTLDGDVLGTFALQTDVKQIVSLAFDNTEAVGSFDCVYWSVIEDLIELKVPELGGVALTKLPPGSGGSTGEGLGLSLTVAKPVKGAYYTTFVTNDLRAEFVAEGTSVQATESDVAAGLLVLEVTARPGEKSKFVKLVVSSAPIAPGTPLGDL